MVVEATVLDGEHRLHHLGRNHLQRDVAPLGSRGRNESRDERRVETDAVFVLLGCRQLQPFDAVRLDRLAA